MRIGIGDTTKEHRWRFTPLAYHARVSSEPLRGDFSRLEIVHTDVEPWVDSPSPGVSRKRLDRVGPAEAGRVTSVVRYAPGSRFPEHPHPDGEEILVLSGVFSDVRGDHPAGSYLLNPEGFVHAPGSEPGCELFVKLRQYPGLDRPSVCLHPADMPWQPYAADGVERIELYRSEQYPEVMHLLRLAPGTALPSVELTGGEELFVLDGSFADEHGRYRRHSWVRYPPKSVHAPRTPGGCLLYVKKNHLKIDAP